jgi:hypothetical protein
MVWVQAALKVFSTVTQTMNANKQASHQRAVQQAQQTQAYNDRIRADDQEFNDFLQDMRSPLLSPEKIASLKNFDKDLNKNAFGKFNATILNPNDTAKLKRLGLTDKTIFKLQSVGWKGLSAAENRMVTNKITGNNDPEFKAIRQKSLDYFELDGAKTSVTGVNYDKIRDLDSPSTEMNHRFDSTYDKAKATYEEMQKAVNTFNENRNQDSIYSRDTQRKFDLPDSAAAYNTGSARNTSSFSRYGSSYGSLTGGSYGGTGYNGMSSADFVKSYRGGFSSSA